MRPGEDRREAVVHLHYGLLAEIDGAMPDLALTRAEIDNLISYIETLR